MRCPACNFENREGVRYCENCGRQFVSEWEDAAKFQSHQSTIGVIQCPSCKARNRGDVRFCENCGEVLSPFPTHNAQIPANPKSRLPGFRGTGLVIAGLIGFGGICAVLILVVGSVMTGILNGANLQVGPTWSATNTPVAGGAGLTWSEPDPPRAADFGDGIQPIAVIDPSVQIPAFGPEEATRSTLTTFSMDLGNPNENPNDGRLIVAEHQGYTMVFFDGGVRMLQGNSISAVPPYTGMAFGGWQSIQLDGGLFLPRTIPLRGFGIGKILGYGAKVGELGWDGAVKIYDVGADTAGWAGEQISHAADVTWDGTKWVANQSLAVGEWVGNQIVDGGMWVWDGTKYVLVKTKDAGVWVWDETYQGGRWVYRKGEAAAEWISLHYDFEKVCGPMGEPGPGLGPSGTESSGYPRASYQPSEGKEEFLELAQAWMPYLQMSKNEKCGAIMRVIAKVLPYRGNYLVDDLAEADRVEIVYTLVFAHDGGRWYGGAHSGDNEGFVIGLLPADQAIGRCGATSPHFQFYAGRTVKHKDVDVRPTVGKFLGTPTNEVIEFAGFVKEIEDFDWHELGTACPGFDDAAYSLWVAESKHATYFSHEECEKTMLGWEVAGITLGGLEECEAGRPLSDLRDRVELWDVSMSAEISPIHGESYAQVARGNPDDPSDLYHVPSLNCPDFNTSRAIPVRFTGIPDNTQWTVTIIGIDDFDPMVGVSGNPFLCNDNSDTAANYRVHGIPGYGDYSGSRYSAQIDFNVVDGGERIFYVDSRDGAPGAFVAIFESPNGGIGISPAGDTDNIFVWGMTDGDMGVYVVSENGGPDLTLSATATNLSSRDEPSMSGFSLTTKLGTYEGKSTDAFLNLNLGGATGEREFVVGSSGSTTGRYAVVIVAGNVPITGLPPAPTIPVVRFVDGPSSIPADDQLYTFTLGFADEGGDVSRLVITSANGGWKPLDFNPLSHLQSGDGYSGVTTFSYRCTTGSGSFSDTLQIYLYDAVGNVSDMYTYPLSCVASAPVTHPPVITSVDGAASIPADGQSHPFWVYFTDEDGDASRLVVTSDNGRWEEIEAGPPLQPDSGNLFSGMIGFYYSCSTTSSFKDTLRIKIYDAAGNVSNTYPFELECKRQLQFPPEIFGSHVSLSFTGGHGSVHEIGDSVRLCYTFTDTSFGEDGIYQFYLYDFQPASPGSNGVDTSGPHKLLASGDAKEGTACMDGSISEPGGYEAFRLEIYKPGFPSDIFLEFAELWIYVQP
ncbi:MAG: zinc ribbon domain-containing protein [Chloroflexota bacterium]